MTTTTREHQIHRVIAPKRMIGYGFLSWIIVFAAAMAMYHWRLYNRPLFESCIAVVLAATAGLLGAAYFRRTVGVRASHGLLLGIVWAGTNVLLDLAVFSAGPMKMPLAAYFADIGVTYLMIPVITTALAAQRRFGATSMTSASTESPKPFTPSATADPYISTIFAGP